MPQLPERPADRPAARPRSWQDLRDWSASLLKDRSGEPVASWNRRIAGSGIDDEPTPPGPR